MTFVQAHRGLSAEQPENTLASFGAAVAAGFPALELDLQATKDGVVVILHDDTLDRTTDGTGEVAGLTWREVHAAGGPGGGVPRLEDLFSMLKAWDGSYNLEVKAPDALPGIADLVRRFGLQERAMVSAMDADVLWSLEEEAPGLPRAYIPLGPLEDGDVDIAKDAGCGWVNADHDFLDQAEVARLRQAGLKVGAWTVNEPQRARELAAFGVHSIITDTRAVLDALPAARARLVV